MVINGSQIGINGSELIASILNTPGISTLINISKAIGIAVLVYIIFLIIRSVTQILYSLRIKNLAKNVGEINKKMDVLISKQKIKGNKN